MSFVAGIFVLIFGVGVLVNEISKYRKNREEVIADNLIRILGEYFLEYGYSGFLWGAGAVLIGIALIIVSFTHGAA